MHREWWEPIVQWTLWGLFMALVMGWIAKSRKGKRAGAESSMLCHPASTLVIGVAGFVLFAGMAVAANVLWKGESSSPQVTILFLAFAVASLTLVADYYFARHYVSDMGIEYGRMMGQRRTLLWSDVQRIGFAPAAKWFVLEDRKGNKARVSTMLMGLPEFARLVLLHVPVPAIEARTHAILHETAQGRPPSIWG